MNKNNNPAGSRLPLRVLRKAVLFLAIVTVFAGLFGCSARPEPPAGELTVVSAAGGRMSRTESYSFSAIRKDGRWMFSTRCCADREKFYVELEDCPITDEEATEILRVAWEEGLLHRVRAYQKPTDGLFAHDAPEYSTFFAFTDGSSASAPIDPRSEVRSAFYNLAEQLR